MEQVKFLNHEYISSNELSEAFGSFYYSLKRNLERQNNLRNSKETSDKLVSNVGKQTKKQASTEKSRLLEPSRGTKTGLRNRNFEEVEGKITVFDLVK